MSSIIKQKDDGIDVFTPASDFTSKEGYSVTLASGVATLSASATVVIAGVIVVGGTVAEKASIAINGSTNGAVDVKLSGTVTRGDRLIQAADGTFVAVSGVGVSGNVICAVANRAGVSGDLCPAFLLTPRIVA